MSERPTLHFAVVIPPFQRGSGGQNTICTLIGRLEDMGHTCSIWLYDPYGRQPQSAAVLRREIVEHFVPVRAPVFKGFDAWHGADVAVATGWETAYPTVMLPGCRARAYLINDHEPEFFPTSAEAIWAARTYELGLYGISASRWLRDLLARRYGQRGTWFRLGVNQRIYHPRPVERRDDTVIFYAREFSGRRAVPLGTLAVEELHRRRPGTRFVFFGQAEEIGVAVPYELLGIASPEVLALHYSAATVGLCLSMTNYSLIPQEMMACGLPVVDLAGGSTEAELGRASGVELAEADPVAIADALELLLDDPEARGRRASAGLGLAQSASWDVAARQVEAGLREALRERERTRPLPGISAGGHARVPGAAASRCRRPPRSPVGAGLPRAGWRCCSWSRSPLLAGSPVVTSRPSGAPTRTTTSSTRTIASPSRRWLARDKPIYWSTEHDAAARYNQLPPVLSPGPVERPSPRRPRATRPPAGHGP